MNDVEQVPGTEAGPLEAVVSRGKLDNTVALEASCFALQKENALLRAATEEHSIAEMRRRNRIMREALERINRGQLGATPDLTMARSVAYQALRDCDG
jgi:hypothetical protein